MRLDRMSNVNFYNANDEWGVKGQSGNSVLGEHFISMARKIKDVEGLRYTDERRRGEYKDNWFASRGCLHEVWDNSYSSH